MAKFPATQQVRLLSSRMSFDLPVDVDDKADDEDQHQYADCSSNKRRVTNCTKNTNNDKKFT